MSKFNIQILHKLIVFVDDIHNIKAKVHHIKEYSINPKNLYT
jgi:hypothetical protein